MKASTIVVAAIASVASAVDTHQSSGHGDSYNCAKPNANYCLAGDIILRCDGNSIGTPGRCSDNLSGYPPFGGVASCYQSSEDAGDAACEKNCVVHAESSSFTLPASQCTPVGTTLASTSRPSTPTSIQTPTGITTQTSYVTPTSTVNVSTPTSPVTVSTPSHNSNSTWTSSGVPPVTSMPGHKVTSTLFVSGSDSAGGSSTGSGAGPTPTTAAAMANRAGGVLAGVGLAVAYFL